MKKLNNLSPRQKKLVRICRENPYCRIHNLHFSNGEPSFRIRPEIERKVRLGQAEEKAKSNSPYLSKEETQLLDHIEREREGLILEIDVRSGQPRDLKLPAEVDRL